jgi:hypothetical protein
MPIETQGNVSKTSIENFIGIIVMYLVNYTSELFKGALNNNWYYSSVNKKSDIFTKTQKLGRIDRFQVSVL